MLEKVIDKIGLYKMSNEVKNVLGTDISFKDFKDCEDVEDVEDVEDCENFSDNCSNNEQDTSGCDEIMYDTNTNN